MTTTTKTNRENRPKGQTRICLKILGFGFIRLFVSKRLVSSFLRIQETSLFVSKASLFVSKSPSLRLGRRSSMPIKLWVDGKVDIDVPEWKRR